MPSGQLRAAAEHHTWRVGTALLSPALQDSHSVAPLGLPLQVEGQVEVLVFGVTGTDAHLSSLTASERLNGGHVSASGMPLEAVSMLYLLPHWQMEMSHGTGVCALRGRCGLYPEECCPF